MNATIHRHHLKLAEVGETENKQFLFIGLEFYKLRKFTN